MSAPSSSFSSSSSSGLCDGTYIVTPMAGLSSDRRYFSCTDDGKRVDLWWKVDDSGRQQWVFQRSGSEYIIQPTGGVGARKYLSCSGDGTVVDLWDRVDGSGRQRWIVRPTGDANTYNIQPSGGTPSNKTFLSCTMDGTTVDLFNRDDKSGRQQWQLTPVHSSTSTPSSFASSSSSSSSSAKTFESSSSSSSPAKTFESCFEESDDDKQRREELLKWLPDSSPSDDGEQRREELLKWLPSSIRSHSTNQKENIRTIGFDHMLQNLLNTWHILDVIVFEGANACDQMSDFVWTHHLLASTNFTPQDQEQRALQLARTSDSSSSYSPSVPSVPASSSSSSEKNTLPRLAVAIEVKRSSTIVDAENMLKLFRSTYSEPVSATVFWRSSPADIRDRLQFNFAMARTQFRGNPVINFNACFGYSLVSPRPDATHWLTACTHGAVSRFLGDGYTMLSAPGIATSTASGHRKFYLCEVVSDECDLTLLQGSHRCRPAVSTELLDELPLPGLGVMDNIKACMPIFTLGSPLCVIRTPTGLIDCSIQSVLPRFHPSRPRHLLIVWHSLNVINDAVLNGLSGCPVFVPLATGQQLVVGMVRSAYWERMTTATGVVVYRAYFYCVSTIETRRHLPRTLRLCACMENFGAGLLNV